MLTNIPAELRHLPQWVCVDMSLNDKGHPKKFPLCPRNGRMASVDDPSTWGTYEECISTGNKTIGFVLTKNDPYTLIDIDDKSWSPASEQERARHQKVLEHFVSYTERSVSGTGAHIIVKGSVPRGVDRYRIGMYSFSRYMIMSGDVMRDCPITDQQALLDVLYSEMQPHLLEVPELVEHESNIEDQDLVDMAMYAKNGDKFTALCIGDWFEMGYTSQSEADYALLAILCFYSVSNEQVIRIFRMTGLGKREKATKDNVYLNTNIKKIRSVQAPIVDTSKLALPSAPAPLPLVPAPTVPQAVVPLVPLPLPVGVPNAPRAGARRLLGTLEIPPGLIGDIAEYIYSNAIRPVPEVALAAAITLIAGITGRNYNISGSGLNQYMVVLAATGSGKEGAASGIDNLITAASTTVPMINQFIGPAAFASGQALIRALDKQKCFISVLGEFGITLQQVCDPNANSAETMFKKVLLDLYAKSGWSKMLRPNTYSDAEKNTQTVHAPNVTILGESTPDTFYNSLSIAHVAEGLIPRFTILEYTGERPKRNRNSNHPPSEALLKQFIDLAVSAIASGNNNTCLPVQIDVAADPILDAFDELADNKITKNKFEVEKQLWNRAHLKVLKLSALIAVGCNPHAPVVTKDIAQWAVNFTKHEIEQINHRFDKGEIGTGEHRHEQIIREAVIDLFKMTDDTKFSYQIPKAILDKAIVPFGYIRRRTRLLAAFRDDHRGAQRALEMTLLDLCKADILQLIPKNQAQAEYGIRSELYIKGSAW